MKMKRWIALTASIGMVLGTMSLTACGGGGGAANIDYTIKIVDQDGDVVQGVSFAVLDGEKTVATLQTDANGVASGAMPAGEYTVSYTATPSIEYDVNPETAGIDIVTEFSISSTAANVTLVISNWTAGTTLNPYTCYYETNEITDAITGEITYETSATMFVPTVKANSDNYYLIAKSGDRIICVEQANVTIIYKGTSYSAKDGAIEIQAQAAVAGDLNDWARFQIINDTDSDIQLVMTFKDVETEEGGDETTSEETTETTSEELGA